MLSLLHIREPKISQRSVVRGLRKTVGQGGRKDLKSQLQRGSLGVSQPFLKERDGRHWILRCQLPLHLGAKPGVGDSSLFTQVDTVSISLSKLPHFVQPHQPKCPSCSCLLCGNVSRLNPLHFHHRLTGQIWKLLSDTNHVWVSIRISRRLVRWVRACVYT